MPKHKTWMHFVRIVRVCVCVAVKSLVIRHRENIVNSSKPTIWMAHRKYIRQIKTRPPAVVVVLVFQTIARETRKCPKTRCARICRQSFRGFLLVVIRCCCCRPSPPQSPRERESRASNGLGEMFAMRSNWIEANADGRACTHCGNFDLI